MSGATHSPWPEQLATPAQSETLHDSPECLSSHSHVKGATHVPKPEQLAVQSGTPHVGPLQPGLHSHVPPGRHMPCGALQSLGQCGVSLHARTCLSGSGQCAPAFLAARSHVRVRRW